MTSQETVLAQLAERTGVSLSTIEGATFGERIAKALGWEQGSARIQTLETPVQGGTLSLTKGFLGPHPAVVFADNGSDQSHRVFHEAPRFAYHSSVHWGVIADESGAVVFNSHWIRDDEWYRLPQVPWSESNQSIEILSAVTPEAVAEGRLEKIAANIREPDRFLLPVDDALVARLDRWRVEALRYGRDDDDRLDEDLHVLFAQLFVLRAVEDRKLRPDMPTLQDALIAPDYVDDNVLKQVYQLARETIQNNLFADERLQRFPGFVLAGVIRDLYVPEQLPRGSQQYNFAWMDADVLGRAYEKYLANVYAEAPAPPQLRLFDQPIREVEPISVKKSRGIFYTPPYLVGTLTDQAIHRVLELHEDESFLPRIADFACGSGSFLVEAVSAVVRRLQEQDPDRNWARELIEQKYVIGIDNDPRAVTMSRMNLWLRLTEEPDALPLPSFDDVVILGDSLSDEVWADLPEAYDIVVGNPPFIATSSIQSREELAKRFVTAKGRFDYSHLFIEQAINKLAPGGVLGMVVPNRLFRNRDAGTIRQLLTTQTDLLSIIDFGSNEVFTGASSYIGAIVAKKRPSPESHRPTKVQALLVSDTSEPRYLGGILIDALEATASEFEHDVVNAFQNDYPVGEGPWLLLSPAARMARSQLEQSAVPLSEVAGIFQGIRTGANDIFIVRMESTDGTFARIFNGFGDAAILEMSMLRPVVYGSDIQRYDSVSPDQMLIYPYVGGTTLSEGELEHLYPKTYEYLSSYQSMLGNRNSIIAGGLHWYELVRKRDETWLTSPKLLTRDLAVRTSFALDSTGEVFLVGGTAIVPPDLHLLLPLLGYLNSATSNEYLAQLTPTFRRSFQKFEPQHLSQLPVPIPIADLDLRVARLAEVAQLVVQAHLEERDSQLLETEINDLILNLIAANEPM